MARKRPQTSENAVELKSYEPWFEDEIEGQLAVDVFQVDDTIVVKSTIAGAHPHDLELFLNRDMLTIRGKRALEEKVEEKDFFLRECYWGKFSRTIILPSDVKSDEAEAVLKDGILTITLPKAEHAREIPVKWLP